ncbi:hypothetical protein [Leptothermofonsia sp. ETS-13]|uniref:hypothetical protein n=1 Tax=Leptothermofonsia sp. ETS-13 TaxID=3035696 RepID=UPI003BA2CFE7
MDKLDPNRQTVWVGERSIAYDYLVVATVAELALDAVPGLGLSRGYTQSVCNLHHTLIAQEAWHQFLKQPGSLVVGAVPGASCFVPAYEFALLADYHLRKWDSAIASPLPL